MGNCVCCVCVRRLVSKKKRRLQREYTDAVMNEVPEGGVDLDLSVVHPNIICMGFPATGFESCYRNPCDDVKEYLDMNYGKTYKVYNLCSEPEHQYDASRFEGRVARFPFPDMTPCPLEMIPRFVKDAVAYIQNPDGPIESSSFKLMPGVVVVHCKAGKGRTGLMACCLLLALSPRQFPDADSVISHYDNVRTLDGRGLTHRSQIRYVHYYATLLEKSNGELPCVIPVIKMKSIVLHKFLSALPKLHQICVTCGDNSETFTVVGDSRVVIDHEEGTMRVVIIDDGSSSSEPARDSPPSPAFLSSLKHDVRIELQNKNGKWIGALCFHTLFVRAQYNFLEVDKVYKNKKMPQDARIELQYDEVSPSSNSVGLGEK